MNRVKQGWDFLWQDIQNLVKRIAVDRRCPEIVVGVSRGGMVPAAMIARQLALPLVSVDPEENLAQFGCCCLIVDDIFDSGATLERLRETDEYEQHVYCCVYNKNLPVDVRQPDYAVDLRTTDWIVFPWESEDEF
jgi:xanthine phosphoribosyltransferase